MREFIVKDWSARDPQEVHATPTDESASAPPARRRPSSQIVLRDAEARPALPEAEDAELVAPPSHRGQEASRSDGPPRQEPAPANGGERAAASQRPRAAKKRGERAFVVSYGGRFIGMFQTEVEVTPRTAFVRVAQDLASRMPAEFRPELLQLWRPALLRSARPSKGCALVAGKLECFPIEKRVEGD